MRSFKTYYESPDANVLLENAIPFIYFKNVNGMVKAETSKSISHIQLMSIVKQYILNKIQLNEDNTYITPDGEVYVLENLQDLVLSNLRDPVIQLHGRYWAAKNFLSFWWYWTDLNTTFDLQSFQNIFNYLDITNLNTLIIEITNASEKTGEDASNIAVNYNEFKEISNSLDKYLKHSK